MYSFKHDQYLPKIKDTEYMVYVRIVCLNLIPSIAVLSINFSKVFVERLSKLILNFLLIVLGISSLYAILVSHNYERSPGIFNNYYISTGHYGLSLIILSVYYYFKDDQDKWKVFLGLLMGLFTIFISSARSPIMAAFVIILLFVIHKGQLKHWIGLLCSVLLFSFSIYFLRQTSFANFAFVNRMYDWIFERNGYGRSYYLMKGWDIFKNNIFVGGRILYDDGMYPHNFFIEVLMSMGVVGAVLLGLYFKDLKKFSLKYFKRNLYYLPYLLFFIQYFIFVQTSGSIFANTEFWCFSAVIISIILFCYDEKIKSYDSRGYTTGNH